MSETRKIYVASSWRNDNQPLVVEMLRIHGYEAYDFKNPKEGDKGFHWREIDEAWEHWSMEQYREALKAPVANAGFKSDYDAMEWANTCLLVLPCGRSAHIEAGYFNGKGKQLIILLSSDQFVPELMYKMADHICITMTEVLTALGETERK